MKRTRIIIGISVLLIVLIIFANKFAFVYKFKTGKTDNILRLHVIANSNSLSDQLLKRKVRDELIKSSKKIFIGLKDLTDAKKKVIANLDYLTNIAQNKVKVAGYNYNVNLKVAEFDFPKRSYGNITLDEGRYEALRVEIGKAKGANWWCVLFPPLCFVDSVDKMPPKMIKKDKKVDNKDVEVKFKFKLAEYLKRNPKLVKSKLNLAKLFNFDDNR